ncbi:MAG: siderophore-interacting protein [Actinomycetota bacterium]
MSLFRRSRPDAELYGEVIETVELSPSMIRVVLGGDGMADFSPEPYTDSYLNPLFVPEGSTLTPPFEPKAARKLDQEHQPRPRRFTVRRWDGDTGQLTIDFVAHGDVGYAGSWAQRAAPGDRLQVSQPGGGYRPDPAADWHLLAGDESALPAIAASLEAMVDGAIGRALVVVDGPAHELDLQHPSGVEVEWLHRRDHEHPDEVLLGAVAALELLPGTPQLFVHGEAGETRAVRKHLKVDRGVDIDGASISPYWRRTFTDEDWRKVKRQWIKDQARDG